MRTGEHKIYNFSPNKNGVLEKDASKIILFYFCSVILRYMISLIFYEPYIMGDELTYKTAALSFYKYGNFYKIYSGVSTDIPNILYPLIVSISFVFKSNFFVIVKLINSLIMNLSYIATYLILREFIDIKKAIYLSLIILAFPFFSYTNVFMPESLYFPLFLFSIYFFYISTIKTSFITSILSGIFLFLLYLTKPHALSLVASLCIILISVLIYRRFFININAKLVYYITHIAPILIFITLFLIWSIMMNRRSDGGIIGFYTRFLAGIDASDLNIKLLLIMIAGHINGILIFFSIPLVVLLYQLYHFIRAKKNKISFFLFITFIVSIITLLMTIKFTIDIREVEGFSRLHERYYFVVFPLIYISFVISNRAQKPSRSISITLIMIMILTIYLSYFILLKKYVSQPPYGFISDYPELTWYWLGGNILRILCLVLYLASIILYILYRKKGVTIYLSYLVIICSIGTSLQYYGINTYHHRNAVKSEEYRSFIKTNIRENSNIAMIENGYQLRTNIAFWLNNNITASLNMTQNSIVSENIIAKGTDYLIVFGKYIFSFQPTIIATRNNCQIIRVPETSIDDINAINGIYGDKWTRKKFTYTSRETFKKLILELSDWQPSVPNRLVVAYDGNMKEVLILDEIHSIELPYASRYVFELDHTFNPNKSGINKDDNRELGISLKSMNLIF